MKSLVKRLYLTLLTIFIMASFLSSCKKVGPRSCKLKVYLSYKDSKIDISKLVKIAVPDDYSIIEQRVVLKDHGPSGNIIRLVLGKELLQRYVDEKFSYPLVFRFSYFTSPFTDDNLDFTLNFDDNDSSDGSYKLKTERFNYRHNRVEGYTRYDYLELKVDRLEELIELR